VSPRRHAADDDRERNPGLADALNRWDTAQSWMRNEQRSTLRPSDAAGPSSGSGDKSGMGAAAGRGPESFDATSWRLPSGSSDRWQASPPTADSWFNPKASPPPPPPPADPTAATGADSGASSRDVSSVSPSGDRQPGTEEAGPGVVARYQEHEPADSDVGSAQPPPPPPAPDSWEAILSADQRTPPANDHWAPTNDPWARPVPVDEPGPDSVQHSDDARDSEPAAEHETVARSVHTAAEPYQGAGAIPVGSEQPSVGEPSGDQSVAGASGPESLPSELSAEPQPEVNHQFGHDTLGDTPVADEPGHDGAWHGDTDPEAAVQGAPVPDTQVPNAAVPDVGLPDVTGPEDAGPDHAGPEDAEAHEVETTGGDEQSADPLNASGEQQAGSWPAPVQSQPDLPNSWVPADPLAGAPAEPEDAAPGALEGESAAGEDPPDPRQTMSDDAWLAHLRGAGPEQETDARPPWAESSLAGQGPAEFAEDLPPEEAEEEEDDFLPWDRDEETDHNEGPWAADEGSAAAGLGPVQPVQPQRPVGAQPEGEFPPWAEPPSWRAQPIGPQRQAGPQPGAGPYYPPGTPQASGQQPVAAPQPGQWMSPDWSPPDLPGSSLAAPPPPSYPQSAPWQVTGYPGKHGTPGEPPASGPEQGPPSGPQPVPQQPPGGQRPDAMQRGEQQYPAQQYGAPAPGGQPYGQSYGRQHYAAPAPGQPTYPPQVGQYGVPQGPPAPFVGYRPQRSTGPRHGAGSAAPPTVEELTGQHLLRQRKPTPDTGWRRAVYTLSAHVVNPGQSPADRRRDDLIARATVPVHGCYRIAVISLKGGVGKTSTAVCLGSTLASLRGDRVIAVDANPDRGTLSGKIPLETVATIRNLLNDVDQIHHYFDVRRYTSQSPDRLEVLASETDPAVSIAFSEQDYRAVASLLQRFYNIVLTDCGTGLLHSAMAGVLDLADQIVLVSSGSVDGARSASATLDWLEAHGRGELVRGSVAVINSVRPKSGGVDLNKLEAHFAARCRAVTRIPYDPHLDEGAEVDLGELRPETRSALLELAANVADAFPREPTMIHPYGGQPPGPIQPGPTQPGPTQAGPVQAGPVEAGPVQAGPVRAAVPASPVPPPGSAEIEPGQSHGEVRPTSGQHQPEQET
jgi:MinD-like ATPase involved in chromosome partitioning or flagellar assembly